MMVHHMDDDPDNQHIDDSTGTHDGTKLAAGEPTEIDSGKIGKGQNFDGDDGILEEVALATGYPVVLSGLVKTSSGDSPIVLGLNKDAGSDYIQIAIEATKWPMAYDRAGGNIKEEVNRADGNWHHICGEFLTSSSRKLYVNGIYIGENTDSGGSLTNHDSWRLGYSLYMDLTGDLDECRASTIERGANWIKFEAKNILEGDNELAWDDETEPPVTDLNVSTSECEK